jgi:hypothetical protein
VRSKKDLTGPTLLEMYDFRVSQALSILLLSGREKTTIWALCALFLDACSSLSEAELCVRTTS